MDKMGRRGTFNF